MANTTSVKTAKTKTTKDGLSMQTNFEKNNLDTTYDEIIDNNAEAVEENIRSETTEEFVFKFSTVRSIGNININAERTMLTADKITTQWIKCYRKGSNGNPAGFLNKSQEILATEPIQIPLKEISVETLEKIRRLQKSRQLKTPLFLFKEYGKYYVAQIKEKMSFITTQIFDDTHLCKNCCHLSALPVEKGGCRKVYDQRKMLEKYTFIDIGYQTLELNASSMEILSICKCENYEKSQPRNNVPTILQKKDLIKSLKESIKEFK